MVKRGGSKPNTPARNTPARKKAAGGRANATPRRAAQEEVEEQSSGDEAFLSFHQGNSDDDEEEEHGIFDLKVQDSDDEDDDKSEESSEDDGDEDDQEYLTAEDDDDEENDLQRLVDNLPLEMRTKIRSKAPVESESEDDEEQDEDQERWGKKKAYYAGDTADLEIGQDFADAEDEEEAAKELHAQKMKRLSQKDFNDDLDASSSEEEEDAQQSKKKKKKATKDKVAKELEAIALGEHGDLRLDDLEVEQLSKDVSKLSKQQKLDLLSEQSPELLTLVRELRERVDELQNRIEPVQRLVSLCQSLSLEVDDDLVDYLDVKQQLLLSYTLHVVFYLYCKTLGKSVRSHPVMRELLRLRYAMEKMSALDAKLKHQIDRLVKISSEAQQEEIKRGLLRPNLAAFLNNDDDEGDAKKKSSKKSRAEDDEEEEDEDDYDEEDDEDEPKKSKSEASEVYRPKKLTAVPYPHEKELEKKSRALNKQKEKLRTSELLAALNDEFGTAPEESGSAGLGERKGDLQRMDEEEKEKLQFEEERFMRHTVTKKEKKAMKRRAEEATRLDNFDDIGEFADLESLTKLQDAASGKRERPMGTKSALLDASSSNALARAMQELQGGTGKGKKSKLEMMAEEFGGDDFDEDGFGERETGRKRRRAPPMEEDLGDDGENNVFDNFVSKKKEFLDKKKEHYTAEPRYGGYEEHVDDGAKRAASYEIIKNRGLTPHRKKENRNARVKKREKYAKALVARKGQVREVITGAAANYGGEGTGIKAQVARSRKL